MIYICSGIFIYDPPCITHSYDTFAEAITAFQSIARLIYQPDLYIENNMLIHPANKDWNHPKRVADILFQAESIEDLIENYPEKLI
jgi:hypothetical protein